jgi:hypothetical protein
MPLVPHSQNIVVTADQVNPAIFGEHWLITKGIVGDGTLVGNKVFTPMFAQARTATFEILVVPERIHVGAIQAGGETDDLESAIGKIIRALPETPYKAMGINFQWHLQMDAERVPEFSRQNFLREKSLLLGPAGAGDGIVGARVIRSAFGGILNLKIDPTFHGDITGKPTGFLIDCNYHFDVHGDDRIAKAESALNYRKQAHKDAKRIAESLEQ